MTAFSNIVAPAVMAAIVAAVVAFILSERKISVENIIVERTKWRVVIRDIAQDVIATLDDPLRQVSKLEALRLKLTININPHDPMDRAIIEAINLRGIERRNGDVKNEFSERISLLLKHDWERAKREASIVTRMLELSPERMTYEDFLAGAPEQYHIRRISVWRDRIKSVVHLR